MKKIFLIIVCIIFMCGCKKNDAVENKDKEKLTYIEMRELLDNYGEILQDKLIDKDANLIDDFVTLEELSNKYEYDISMFVNEDTENQCNLKESGLKFKKNDNGIISVNSVLVCDEIFEIYVFYLYDKMVEYLDDIYNNDEWMNGGLEPSTYNITLRELENMGYDISMFINIETKEQCDLDNSYGVFKILGTTDDGKTDYEYGFVHDCGEY